MTSFNLNTGRARALTGFENRTSDVFGSLGGLEKNYDDSLKQRGPDEFIDEDRQSPERDAGFKRPAAPPRSDSGRSHSEHGRREGRDHPRWSYRGGRSSNREGRHGKRKMTPDHRLHPGKWTKYSLEDTDISGESTNKRAAVDFLRELRERKVDDQHSEEWDANLHCGKIEFKKPVEKSSDDAEGQGGVKGHSYGNVHRMPEYVFGQGQQSRGAKPKRLVAQSSRGDPETGGTLADSGISFGHLVEDDDEGDNDDNDQPEKGSSASDQSETVTGTTEFGQSEGGKEKIPSGTSQSTATELVVDHADKKLELGSVDDSTKSGKNEKPEIVGFQKKGKGKRNIRGRRTDDDG